MFNTKIIKTPITIEEIKESAEQSNYMFTKAVVDIELKIMAIGSEMHVDEEQILLEQGSKQENLWGINIWPTEDQTYRIEFDSMINLRPPENKSRSVDDPKTQTIIIDIVKGLINS